MILMKLQNSDLEAVQELIRDIREAIDDEKTGKNKSIAQLITSIVGCKVTTGAAILCKCIG